jgi:hypothetical protein
MTWIDAAWEAINAADRKVPTGAGLKERMAIIDAAYPFGERAHHPYKMWLRARKQYEIRHGGRAPRRRPPELPLEKLIRLAAEGGK